MPKKEKKRRKTSYTETTSRVELSQRIDELSFATPGTSSETPFAKPSLGMVRDMP